jgi:hypothetical protein
MSPPPVPPPRFGRHIRRAMRRVAAGVVAACGLVAALLAVGGVNAAAVVLAVLPVAGLMGGCRVIAAHDADRWEQRWLRHMLGSLDDDGGAQSDDEDSDVHLA